MVGNMKYAIDYLTTQKLSLEADKIAALANLRAATEDGGLIACASDLTGIEARLNHIERAITVLNATPTYILCEEHA